MPKSHIAVCQVRSDSSGQLCVHALCCCVLYVFLPIFLFLFVCLFSDGCFVSLTQNTVQFAKSSLQLVDDLLRLYTIELETLIGVAIETVFNAQMMQFQAALKAEKFQADVS